MLFILGFEWRVSGKPFITSSSHSSSVTAGTCKFAFLLFSCSSSFSFSFVIKKDRSLRRMPSTATKAFSTTASLIRPGTPLMKSSFPPILVACLHRQEEIHDLLVAHGTQPTTLGLC